MFIIFFLIFCISDKEQKFIILIQFHHTVEDYIG